MTNEVQMLISLAQASDDFRQEAEYQEKALNECQTTEDWQACFDAFGERNIGEYVANNPDEETFGPEEGAGLAYLVTEDGTAIVSQWFTDGRYDVTFTNVEEAGKWIDELNAEMAENEEQYEENEEQDEEIEE